MGEDELTKTIKEIKAIENWIRSIGLLKEANALNKFIEKYKEMKYINDSIEGNRLRDMCYKMDGNYIHKDKIRNFIKEETKEGTYDFVTISAERLKELLKEE